MMHNSNATTTPIAPKEPELELDDIQGAVVSGFLKPFQALIGIQCPPKEETSFKKFVGAITRHVADGRHALADRRTHRASRRENFTKEVVSLTGVAFSYRGLAKLTPG